MEHVFPDLGSFSPFKQKQNRTGQNYSTVKIWKRRRKGGVRQRLKNVSLSKTPLPTIILANVQSLWKKTDELQAMVKFQHDYRNVCLMALTETWLSEGDSDSGLRLDDFGVPVRMDRDARETGKVQEGGVCLYIRENWCKSVSGESVHEKN